MSVRLPAALAVGLALGLAGAAPAAAQPRLLATIGMIADPAQRIAGDCAAVDVLVPAGSDPHLYTPRPSDIARLRAADRIVALGLGLEGRLAQVLEQSDALILGDGIDPATLLTEDGAPDPHLWMDAALWPQVYPRIAEALTALAPDCADGIAGRLRAEAALAADLDAWVRAAIATIPAENRILLTAHDAFGYYAAAYGLEALGVQGISTEAEASVADVESLAQLVAERRVPAVFIEATVNPRLIGALVEAATARGHTPGLGDELLSDALGEGVGATWPGMIVHNTRAIATALGGTVPDLPASVASVIGD
jgi:manganese/zinc/iron transport system substrate-binding protein